MHEHHIQGFASHCMHSRAPGRAGALKTQGGRARREGLLATAFADLGLAMPKQSKASCWPLHSAAERFKPLKFTLQRQRFIGIMAQPWNREQLVQRAATFRVSWWFAKPVALSPLQCARFGWINCGPDLLRCECCEQRLCFQINPLLKADGRKLPLLLQLLESLVISISS